MPALRENVQAPINYAATLRKFWKDAKAPRDTDAPTVVSLFAGCGGSSLGYAMAGYDERLAVEWDDHAAATFSANFPEVKLYHGDIAKLTDTDALNLARVKAGELDVLDGSPPCQGFSTAGKRIIDDPRNSLFREYVRLLRAFRPRAFVMENVSGMVKGLMKPVFTEILKELRGCDYNLSVRLLNATWYGVPQFRQRVIFVGIRNDLRIEGGHPAPTALKLVPLREACEGIDALGPKLKAKLASAYSVTKRGEGYDKGLMRLGARASYFNAQRLSWSRPTNTITKQVQNGFVGFAHPDKPHLISIEAAKWCQSFPDDFKLDGKYNDQWARIGNSVPPLLMRAVAAHVRQLLGR